MEDDLKNKIKMEDKLTKNNMEDNLKKIMNGRRPLKKNGRRTNQPKST